jgi:hypothetical protein
MAWATPETTPGPIPTMATPSELSVITTQLADGRGPGDWQRDTVERPLAIDRIKVGFDAFLAQMTAILDRAESAKMTEFQLEEIHVVAEVGADGDWKLIGGATAAVQGGVRLTLRRRHTLETADLVRSFNGTKQSEELSDNIQRTSVSTKPADQEHPVRNSLATRDADQSSPVLLRHLGAVPTFETNVPLPVISVT